MNQPGREIYPVFLCPKFPSGASPFFVKRHNFFFIYEDLVRKYCKVKIFTYRKMIYLYG